MPRRAIFDESFHVIYREKERRNFCSISSKHIAGVLSLVALFLFSGFPALAYHPSLKWKTLNTAHFAIHYDASLEEQAQKAAAISEEAYTKITRDFDWKPHGRTQMVLLDELDIANGSATPFPYNAMTLYLPAPDPNGQLGDTDDWLRLVITHEYAHIVHLDMAIGLPKIYRSVFGRTFSGIVPFLPSAFPNLSAPIWMVEGYPTYMETRHSSAGRGRSSFFDMMLRCDILENRFRSLGQMTDWQTAWPGGTIRYLYGESFLNSIFNELGKETPGRLAQIHAELLFPALTINAAPARFGRTYETLYQKWNRQLQTKYKTQSNKIQEKPLRTGLPLTQDGFSKEGPRFSPNGKWMAYTENNANRTPGLRLIDRSSGKIRTVAEGWIDGRLDWSPASDQILFSQLDFFGAYRLRRDLYLYSLKNRRVHRLTRGERAQDPAWNSDGTAIAYVRLKPGGHDLMTMDPKTKTIKRLLEGQNGTQFSRPAWSPDGRALAFSRWTNDAHQDIVVYWLEENRMDVLTNDRALDLAPAWSLDGKTIYFSSDRTGVYNLFAFSLPTRQITQITNVLGGAFFPDPSPQGDALAFTHYSSQGFDLHTLPLSESLGGTPPPYNDPHPPLPPPPPTPATEKAKPFSRASTLLPRFWFPNFMGGILLAGVDPLGENAYSLITYNGPSYEAAWSNQSFYPLLHFNAWDISRRVPLFGRGYSLKAELPLPHVLSAQSFSLGVEKRTLDLDRSRREEGRAIPLNYPAQQTGVTTDWAFTNARVYGYSVSPEKGRSLSLNGYHQEKTKSFSTLRASWAEFFPGWGRHHALALGVHSGFGNAPVFDSMEGPTTQLLSATMSRYLAAHRPGSPAVPRSTSMTTNLLPPLKKDDLGFFNSYSEINLSYYFPIAYVEKGPRTGFFFLDRIYGHLFSATDRHWASPSTPSATRTFVGAEVGSWWGVGYLIPLTLSLDVQKQITNGDPISAHLRLDLLWL